ncbi:chromatin remodeling complex Adenosinetriphosphatase [Blastocladiella emersonii ATCC 22665]|nr:chromatin remodeling complex Adenosinetriphosphatase [Blastocladiella emersonii ATCC 22665]
MFAGGWFGLGAAQPDGASRSRSTTASSPTAPRLAGARSAAAAAAGGDDDPNGADALDAEGVAAGLMLGEGGDPASGDLPPPEEWDESSASFTSDEDSETASDDSQFDLDADSDDDEDDSEDEDLAWIPWFTGLNGNEYLTLVAEPFIEDEFNLTGLAAMVPYFHEALNVILDRDTHDGVDVDLVESSAQLLYMLIHARFIATKQGLQSMLNKLENREFGTCPRTFCYNYPLLPLGEYDHPGMGNVKLYCHSCHDMYNVPSTRLGRLDGAAFGSTFPHLLFTTYPDLHSHILGLTRDPGPLQVAYVPRIFGFRVSEAADSPDAPRMGWLRHVPGLNLRTGFVREPSPPPADSDAAADPLSGDSDRGDGDRGKADRIKRYAFLLGQTDLFAHFLGEDVINALKEETSGKGRGKGGQAGSRRHRKTEAEEDAELINDDDDDDEQMTKVFTESPSYVVGGTMRDYQLQGLNWMISLYDNGVNGILADEMGLGKTLQTISFLGYLKHFRDVSGPHLVVVPKSTLHNWFSEFQRWVPSLDVFVFHGNKDERQELISSRLVSRSFDVCVTSYEMCLREQSQLKKINFESIVIDEAHRIKNEQSALSKIMRELHSRNRLLITGTPLQNNLHELWALLNFLLPDVFHDSDTFTNWVQSGEERVEQLHRVLQPFLLRRVKSQVEKSLLPKKRLDIYVTMSAMQKKWYQQILEKNVDAVNGAIGANKSSRTRLLNIVMQLRKCCNHPYLFEGAEPGPPYTTDFHLVANSGKMLVLDKLLARLRAAGSRVLIFSQMSRMLDILEDYCQWRDFEYCRIDGGTAHEDRIRAIDDYNAPDSSKFVFLLTTRAGGLGINLTTADTVIFMDVDWNPQSDLQAEDRAHRIGQQKQVVVYRLISENAIDEKILERATQKMQLDRMVIQSQLKPAAGGSGTTGAAAGAEKETASDYLAMIRHGAAAMFHGDGSADGQDVDVEELLRRSEERSAELNAKYANARVEDLVRLNHSAYEWDGEDYRKKKQGKMAGGFEWIGPAKRDRRGGNDTASDRAVGGPSAPKKPKLQVILPTFPDFQFFDKRFVELKIREFWQELRADKEKLEDLETADHASAMAAEPLTADEEKEMRELESKAFTNWTKREFNAFLRAHDKHGRADLAGIAAELAETGKTEDEVRAYAAVFWERFRELDGWEKRIGDIEKAERRHRQDVEIGIFAQLLLDACEGNPLLTLPLHYNPKTRGKPYSDDEDRFLVVTAIRYGLDRHDVYEHVHAQVQRSPVFRFSWYARSRTPVELGKRIVAVLSVLLKEGPGPAAEARRKMPVTATALPVSPLVGATTAAAKRKRGEAPAAVTATTDDDGLAGSDSASESDHPSSASKRVKIE